MPQDSTAEETVLSALMTDPEESFPKLEGVVTPQHFYRRSHRILYEVAVGMWKKGEPVEVQSLCAHLKDSGRLEECGGIYGVNKIAGAFVTSANLDFYIERLGTMARARRLIEIGTWMIHSAHEQPDASDMALAEAESRLASAAENQSSADNLTEQALGFVQKEVAHRREGKRVVGILTGVDFIDRALGGLVNGRMTAIAARPGYGKTSLVEQMVAAMLAQDRPALVFERDMSVDAFLTRMACRCAGVSYRHFLLGKPTKDELALVEAEAKRLADPKRLVLLNPPRLTGEDFKALVRRYHRSHGIQAVFLDHFQTMDATKDEDLRIALTKASSAIKNSMLATNLPHVVIAHLNRNADDGRPRAGHIKECDGLFADSDTVILLWNRAKSGEKGSGVAGDGKKHLKDVIATFDKNRHGLCGDEYCSFDTKLCQFVKRQKSQQEEDYPEGDENP